MEAFELGAANQHDLFDHLLSGRSRSPFDPSNSFSSLQMAATALHRGALPATVVPIIERVLQRVLEIELERGEKETCVTPAAMALGYGGGLDVLVRVLQAIGNDPKLQRNFAWGASQGKMTVFSHLIQVTFPGKGETPREFAEAAEKRGHRRAVPAGRRVLRPPVGSARASGPRLARLRRSGVVVSRAHEGQQLAGRIRRARSLERRDPKVDAAVAGRPDGGGCRR